MLLLSRFYCVSAAGRIFFLLLIRTYLLFIFFIIYLFIYFLLFFFKFFFNFFIILR